MKKLLLYVAVCLAFAKYMNAVSAVDVLLPRDVVTWLGRPAIADTRFEMCQKIGKKGRLLSQLNKDVKEFILDRCEYELLGMDRREDYRTTLWSELPVSVRHPQAWFYLSGKSTSEGTPAMLASFRFDELKEEKKPKASHRKVLQPQGLAIEWRPEPLQTDAPLPPTPQSTEGQIKSCVQERIDRIKNPEIKEKIVTSCRAVGFDVHE